MFMAIMTTTKPSHVPASMLMPNIRASIEKSLVSMKRKKYAPLGTPQKIVASPVLEAVLRRLDLHQDPNNPDRRKNVNTHSRS